MSELALQLIKEAKEKRLAHLDLGYCSLNELPKELFELEWLEQLNLGEYFFSYDIPFYHHCSYPGGQNQIEDLSPLIRFKYLKNLSIEGVSDVPYDISHFSFLNQLENLETLLLRSFKLKSIDFLTGLEKLRVLDIAGNEIDNIKPVENFQDLILLNLENNNKITDLSPIEKLNKLLALYLRNTGINDLSSIANCIELHILDLQYTNVNDLSPLNKMTNLVNLNISGTKVTNLNNLNKKVRLVRLGGQITGSQNITFLKNQKKLEELSIKSEVNIEYIKYLPKLQKLELSHLPEIVSLAPLSKHPLLNTLVISFSKLNDLSPLSSIPNLKNLAFFVVYAGFENIIKIGEMKKLEFFQVSYSDIDNIKFISGSKSLRTLIIEGSQIQDISPVINCTELRNIVLFETKVENIKQLEALINLENLVLEGAPIDSLLPLKKLIEKGLEVSTDPYNDEYSYSGIHVHRCPITFPPLEVVKQGNEAILRYFDEWKKQGFGELFEAKIVVAGAGEAGKTTLIKKLLNPAYKVPNLKDKRTEGIAVKSYSFPGSLKGLPQDLKAHIWDFGGQELYHTTHQLFLTPDTLYILVTDNRKNDTSFHYWLNTITLRAGKNCPILVVFNAKDNASRQIHLGEELFHVFVNLVKEPIEVNFADKDTTQIYRLKKLIEGHFSRLKVLGKLLPLNWVKIRKELSDLTEENITWSRFEEICTRCGISDLDQMRLIAQTFHNLGILLYFQDVFGLENIVILNPKWCVEAVYLALDTPEIKNNFGRFNEKTLAEKWADKRFAGNHLQLLKLMQHFDLCYQIEGTNDYIAPQLLPLDEHRFDEFPNKGSIVYRFDYLFMPAGLLTRMIARLSRYIKTPYVWRNGVTLEWEEGTIAEIIEHQYSRKVELRVNGPERKRRLAEIRKILLNLHQMFRGLKFDELVACNCEDCINSDNPTTYELKSLEDDAKHYDEVKCTNGSRKKIPARDILEGIEYVDIPRLFISYSHKNEAYKDDFRKMIKPMETGEQWKVWDDRWLLPGDNWNQEILHNLSEANIIVLLLTSDFFNSNYINDIEMTRAIQRHEARDALIIGIIVSDCMWEETPLRKIQMLPKDAIPIDRHPHPNEVWKAVANKIKEAIDKRGDKRRQMK